MKFNPNPKPYRPRPMGRAPMFPHPKIPKEEVEEKHYWTAQQWEDWAVSVYNEYEDAILPEWFLQAMEQEEE